MHVTQAIGTRYIPLLLIFLCINSYANTNTVTDTEWTFIGAGASGLAFIGMLLDNGIDPQSITCVDPHFNVGRLGDYYYNVPGNTTAEHFIAFVNECETFQKISSPALDYLRNYYPFECCHLKVVIDALKDITKYLKKEIKTYTDTVSKIEFKNNKWNISLKSGTLFTSYNLILATGSHPKVLTYTNSAPTIPLDDALDKERLQNYITPEDTIALIGDSHSAMLVLKHLYELGITRIINFYLNDITYAYDMGEGNIPDYNGLKGDIAEWVFNVYEKEKPASIIRIKNNKKARKSLIPLCTKIIYAVGYERNQIPITGMDSNTLEYDPLTGVITPRLFGVGIAFPEKIIDPWGKEQFTVGIIDFLNYAQRIVPNWITKKQQTSYLAKFKHLFDIRAISPPQPPQGG